MLLAFSKTLRWMGGAVFCSTRLPMQSGWVVPIVAQKSFSTLKDCATSATLHIPTYTLSNRERDNFIEAVKPIALSPYDHYFQLLEPLGRIFRRTISSDLWKELKTVALEQKYHGVFLKNCPVNLNPGPTPDDDGLHLSKGFLEEFFLLGLTHVRGYVPHHDRKERHGLVFLPIITLKGHEQELSSRGLGFPWHTEHIHLGEKEGIDAIDLLCIKGDPKAATGIFSVEGFLQGLPKWMIAGMQKPIFRMQTGPSWPSTKIERIQPIIGKNLRDDFTIRFNHDFTHRLIAINEEASAVLNYLIPHLKTVEQREISLAPGDCLTIHNRRAVHQRRVFTSSLPHKERRWVIGLYTKEGAPVSQNFGKLSKMEI